MAAVQATLLDMNWNPNTPGEWTIPCGLRFSFEGAEGLDRLDFEVGSSLEQSIWAQASQHFSGSGVEYG
eukprot:4807521-Pyramimonas_sp.AAC.1